MLQDKLMRVICPLQPVMHLCENEPIRARLLRLEDFSRWWQEEELIISNRRLASCEKMLRTCDAPSATCNLFCVRRRCDDRKIVPRNMAFGFHVKVLIFTMMCGSSLINLKSRDFEAINIFENSV